MFRRTLNYKKKLVLLKKLIKNLKFNRYDYVSKKNN